MLKTIVVITDYLGRARCRRPGFRPDVQADRVVRRQCDILPVTTAAQDLVIETPIITFSRALPDVLPYPGGTATFTATSSSGSPVTVTLAPGSSAFCTLSGGPQYTLTAIAVGTCTLIASAGATVTYTDVTVPKVILIKTAQTIDFGALASKTYGDGDFPVSAIASSGLTVTFSSSTTSICTVTGNTVHIVAAGTPCTIAADQAGNDQYFAASTVTQTFTVNKAAQTISFPAVSPAPVFVAGGTGTFTVAATGGASGNPVTFTSTTLLVCTVSGTTVTMKSAGSCTLAADQAGSDNYFAAPQVIQTVSIGKAAQTITFAGPGNQTYPSAAISLSASASSGLPVAFAATGNCTVAGSTLTLTSAGSCTITASQAGDGSFLAATNVVRTIAILAPELLNQWTLLPARMTTPRLYHTATRFESGPLFGQVLIAGGLERSGQALASSELYDPATRSFSPAGNMPSKSFGHTATLLGNGKVVVFGGGNSSVQLFDPATRNWSSGGSLSSNRSWHTATVLADGRVMVIGGADNAGKTLDTTILYNPANGTYVAGPVMDQPRERHTATSLPNGKVLVVGGRKKNGNNYATHATFTICDATACTASTGGVAARHSHAAASLGLDGSKVLVAGGANGNSDLATADLYDFIAGTWTSTGLGALVPARRELTLSEAPNGRALAAGGSSVGMAKNQADFYTPPLAPVVPMNVLRAGHTATPLEDVNGNITGILVIGGASGTVGAANALDSAEIYGTP